MQQELLKETENILNKVFNILIVLEESNPDTKVVFDSNKGSLLYRDLMQEIGYEVTSSQLRDFFIDKFGIDIE